MNKNYLYVDGNAVVLNDDGYHLIEYYDNLDDVLVQKNVVETIENEIKKLGDIKILPKKRFIPFITICITIGILIAPLILSLISGTNIYTTFVDTAFGKINLFKIIASICGITVGPIALLCDIANHQSYNDFVKHNNAKTCELEFLKRKLIEERQKLETLKNKNIESKGKADSTFKVVKINDIEQLKQLKYYLELYYSLGYNIEKLYKYLENGTLEEKLSESYNNDDIELAKNFLEENGTKLIKKFK